MNSTLKTVVGLVLLVGVIFGATLIYLNVGETTTPKPGDDGADQAEGGLPLHFGADQIFYDPTSPDMVKRTFPGYYEVGEEYHRGSFWFYNRRNVPVHLAVLKRSCTACTSARVAVLPPAAVKAVLAHAALGGGPVGPLSPLEDAAFNPPPPGLLPGVADGLLKSARWADLDFDHPEQSFEIPPAGPDGPAWGVFEMIFKVTAIGRKPLHATVSLAAGSNPPVTQIFSVGLVGAQPFSVSPPRVAFEDLPEGASPKTRELYYWSATRGFDALPPPTLGVPAGDRFLRVGQPVPMTDAELAARAAEEGSPGQPARARAGYKFSVTVYRRVPDPSPGAPAEPDIGPFERQVAVSCPGSPHTVAVPVTATVTGLVALRDAKEIDLKDFNGNNGTEQSFTLVSDRQDLQLEALPDECKPPELKVSVAERPAELGRRVWTVKVVVPPRTVLGPLPADSVAVLRAKTASGTQKVRLVVKGTGHSR